jgi:hypothetical protein
MAEDVFPPGDSSTARSRLWAKVSSGDKLYEMVEPRAKGLKALGQMVIGTATVPIIAVMVWMPRFNRQGIAELALHVVAISLALAAAIELTYTLFTPGPDEAVDPLILGLSSLLLIQISSPSLELTPSKAAASLLLVVALAVLFLVREIFIERSRSHVKMSTSADNGTRAPNQ